MKPSDIMVDVATYVQEEDWDDVFEMLLDLSKEAYQDGFREGANIGKRLAEIVNEV